MKSLHYIATIVNAYRRCIDEYYETGKVENMDQYIKDISRGENRQVSHGFLAGDVTCNEEIYNNGPQNPSHEFCGIVQSYDPATKKVVVEQRNYFTGHRDIEILTRHNGIVKVPVEEIYDKDMNVIDAARHSQMKVIFYSGIPLEQFDLIR